MYHVTPYSVWLRHIRHEGLIPKKGKRGIYAEEGDEPRIYLFEDPATAEDALMNWMLDEFPATRWFAMLEVWLSRNDVVEDPEIAGAYYITRPVEPMAIQLFEKVDGGEPE